MAAHGSPFRGQGCNLVTVWQGRHTVRVQEDRHASPGIREKPVL
jgi:hypothetical protein